uniref:Uncharacterized protein LOC105037382 n=1 Tax=Elaeis guineensis var. tenera TaxID=51953 RepID=A0A6I9QKV0_ELAGV|nr:uncharacterized protein LOC105037382 [Elaeis guineensis]
MLQDKVAVVTGAGRGIGRDIALMMAAQGAKVVVNDIGASVGGEGNDASHGQQVVNEIKAAGGQAVLSTDSVSTWPTANRIIECAADTFGRIDIVVNNAGILRDRLFFNMSPEEWSAVIDVHLNGSFFTSRAAAPHFKTQKSGAYVHMTSTSGLIGNLGQANYAAAKLGIVAMSRHIAGDMQRYNIAPMATFLASDAAADVTAQIFAVRGNEIFLMSQSRPIRGMHTAEGWTPETIAERVLPAMKQNFYPLESSNIVFSWDPV